MATPVCFESTQSRIVSRIVASSDGTNLMVLATNDGWFGAADRGREMHLAPRWRCLELGLPMVRSANTGISAVIDHKGRVLGRVEPDTSGVLSSPCKRAGVDTLWCDRQHCGLADARWHGCARDVLDGGGPKGPPGRKLGTNA